MVHINGYSILQTINGKM